MGYRLALKITWNAFVHTLLLLLCSSGVSLAASAINTTKHNLSTTGTGVHSTNETDICIFCHAPHDTTTRGALLWNRRSPENASYLMYSSETVSNAAKAGKLNQSSYSMFCLSCHDGSLADITARIINTSGLEIMMVDPYDTWKNSSLTMDGKGLSNDHPIGFDYVLAQQKNPLLRSKEQVNSLFGMTADASIFYKSTATGSNDSFECSTCHVVHDNTYPPFLRISNVGSNLCMSCHIK